MLKKLLKMNLAVLLAGSSASVLSTNNLIYAEESLQSENNSDVKQNELSEKTTGELTQTSPTITNFEIDQEAFKGGNIVIAWDFETNGEGEATVKLEMKEENEDDSKYTPLEFEGKSFESPEMKPPFGELGGHGIVFKLTVTVNGKSVSETLNIIIHGGPFAAKTMYFGDYPAGYDASFTSTGESINIDANMFNVSKDLYTLRYYKKNVQSNEYESIELPIIEVGDYKVEATTTEKGEKYFNVGTCSREFKVIKGNQPENETIIKDYEGFDITVGERPEYKLLQKNEVKDGAKVIYTSEGGVSVDENGTMTLLYAGEYKIDSEILDSTNLNGKKLDPITGKITAGPLSLASTTFTTKVNTQFDLAENVLFKTIAGKSIKGSELGNYNSVTYTVKANDLGVAEGAVTSIKPTKSGKLSVTVEVKQTDSTKALYQVLKQDVEINVEAVSHGGGSSSSSSNGWKSNGAYYEKGKPVSGIKEIKGATYLLDAKGMPVKSQKVVVADFTYITNESGVILKGKTEFEGATYVLDKTDGHMLRDWALVDGEWYFMSYETGKVHMNLWAPSASGDWYFMDAEGHMKKNQWIAASEGRWYYVGADGKMVSNGSVDGCWINEQGIYLSPMYKG